MTASVWSLEARSSLTAEVEQLIRTAAGTWSVMVSEGEAVLEVAGDLEHDAASTIKLPLLVEALRRIDDGWLSLDDVLGLPDPRDGSSVLSWLPSVRTLPLGECLQLMTTVSDNVATNAVIGALGGLEAADAALRDAGWARTRLGRLLNQPSSRGPGNITTARDLAEGLERFVRGDGLGPDSRGLAREWLGRQRSEDRLPAGLDDEVRCLHKTGELDGVRHDAGVLLVAGREIVVVVLGSDLPDAGTVRVAAPTARWVIGGVAAAVVTAVRGQGH